MPLPQRHAFQSLWNVLQVGDPKVHSAALYVFEHVAVDAVPDLDLDTRVSPPVLGDGLWQHSMSDRHQAGDNNLPPLLFRAFFHGARRNPQVVGHALGQRHEFVPRVG